MTSEISGGGLAELEDGQGAVQFFFGEEAVLEGHEDGEGHFVEVDPALLEETAEEINGEVDWHDACVEADYPVMQIYLVSY